MALIKNFLFLSGAEVISKLFTFAAFAYLGRVVGPEGFGYIEFAGAVLLCAGLIVDQGFSPYGAREIAKSPQRTSELVTEIVAIRCILALGAYLAVSIFALTLDHPPVVFRLLLLYGLSLIAMPFLLQWVFQGHDQMQLVARTQVVRQIVFAAYVFLFVREGAHIWRVAIAELAGICSAAIYSVWMYQRRFGGVSRGPSLISRRLLREGAPIGLSQMFWMVKMFGATLILGMIASAEDVGFFAGAMRFLIALHAFVWLYYFNLLPSLARSWQESHATFAGLIERSMRSVAWISVTGGIVWLVSAPIIIRIVYGPTFSASAPVLQWLAVVCVVAALSGHYRYGLIAAGRQTAEMTTAGLGAIIAAILIPLGYGKAGPSGAAMGLVVAELLVWLGAWWCGRYILDLRRHVQLVVRPLLSMALALGLPWFLPFSALGGRIIITLATFITFAFAIDKALRDYFRQGIKMYYYWLKKQLGRDALAAQPSQEDLML